MNFCTSLSLIMITSFACKYTAMEIKLEDTEHQNNILKFGYRINYKYTGTISHSFDRFYVVTKFELPRVQDLQFTIIPYDKNCEHLEDAKSKGGLSLCLIDEIKTYCIKIAPYIQYYKKQREYYNQTATDIMTNEIALMLPTFNKNGRQKRGIITSLITGFIGLAHEGIVKVQNGCFLIILCFIPRQLRFSLYSGAVITEGLM